MYIFLSILAQSPWKRDHSRCVCLCVSMCLCSDRKYKYWILNLVLKSILNSSIFLFKLKNEYFDLLLLVILFKLSASLRKLTVYFTECFHSLFHSWIVPSIICLLNMVLFLRIFWTSTEKIKYLFSLTFSEILLLM